MTRPSNSPVMNCLSIFVASVDRKMGRVGLGYPRYRGAWECQEPFAGKLALRLYEVDIEAAVYGECLRQIRRFAVEDEAD